VGKTEDGEEEKKPSPQRHDRVGLKGEKEFPKKMRSFEIIDEGKDSNDHWKGGNISSDLRNGLISLSAKKIGRG